MDFRYQKKYYYNLLSKMKKYGITQNRIAEIAKTTQTTISHKFTSGEPFSMVISYRILMFFKSLEPDITFEELFFDNNIFINGKEKILH